MNALPVKVRQSPMPASWRESIARARKDGVPEIAVQLIAAAAKPGAIPAEGWNYAVAVEARKILSGLPRAGARCRRLRGLIMRLAPAKPPKPKQQERWLIVGNTLPTLDLRRRAGDRRVRASGTLAEMQSLLREAQRRWTKLPGGREIETLETERIAKS